MSTKPKHESGYSAEETQQVVDTILTVMRKLGALTDSICIVGGIVPRLLIDLPAQRGTDEGHCGSNDLDVAFALALLDKKQYADIPPYLDDLGFRPNVKENGEIQPQKWSHKDLKIEIDFLIPVSKKDTAIGIKHLDKNFAALKTRALESAFADAEEVLLKGYAIDNGREGERRVKVCGPGAFIILKAFAFHNRTEPKDAYDIEYVLANYPGGVQAVASRLDHLRKRFGGDVNDALDCLRMNYRTIDHDGPQACADFTIGERDEIAADAQGHVAELIGLLEARAK